MNGRRRLKTGNLVFRRHFFMGWIALSFSYVPNPSVCHYSSLQTLLKTASLDSHLRRKGGIGIFYLNLDY